MSKINKETGEISHTRHQLNFKGQTRTKQEFKNESKIQTIMERVKNGGLPPLSKKLPQYGDFFNVIEYQTALDKVNKMADWFINYPANIRGIFDNNPAKMLEFLQNPDNKAKAIELGLLAPSFGGVSGSSEPVDAENDSAEHKKAVSKKKTERAEAQKSESE